MKSVRHLVRRETLFFFGDAFYRILSHAINWAYLMRGIKVVTHTHIHAHTRSNQHMISGEHFLPTKTNAWLASIALNILSMNLVYWTVLFRRLLCLYLFWRMITLEYSFSGGKCGRRDLDTIKMFSTYRCSNPDWTNRLEALYRYPLHCTLHYMILVLRFCFVSQFDLRCAICVLFRMRSAHNFSLS